MPKRIILHLIMILVFTSTQAQSKLDIYTFQLPNGLKVVLNRDTSFNEAAFYLFADAGFSKEQSGQHGLAHLFEHVMLPTRYFHNAELSRNASQHSVNSNAQVFNDFVRYYLQYDKNGIDYPLIAFADRLDFQLDSLTEEGLQRHINNVVSEISRSESFGSFRWRPAFRQAQALGIFGAEHPYGHEQSLTDVTHATRKDVATWFRRQYGAANATLMVLGNVHPDSLRKKVEKYFGAIDPGKQSLEQLPSLPQFNETRRAEIALNQDKHVIYYGWAVPGYGTKEDDQLRLLPSILSDPEKGILTSALKAAGIQNAKAFSVLESFKHASVFDIGVEFSNWADKAKIDVILKIELRKLASRPVAVQHLQSVGGSYALTFIKGMEDIGMYEERINELGKGSLFLNNPLYFQERLDRLSKITPQQIQQTIATYLTKPPFTAIVRGRTLEVAKQQYDYKNLVPFTPPSPPSSPTIFTKEVGENVSIHAVKLSRIPVVNFLVVLENKSGLPGSEMTKYQQALKKAFESDPQFLTIQAKGLESGTGMIGNGIYYKISIRKENSVLALEWLTRRINELSTVIKDEKATDQTSQMEQTLTYLKQLAIPVSTTYGTYPVAHIHILAIGDLEPGSSAYNWAGIKATKLAFKEGNITPGEAIDPEGVLVKEIGETPTSFLTLGHFLKPTDVKEEMYQQLIVHILRGKLMANLRERNGLAYEVYPYSSTPAGTTSLGFWQTSVPVEKTERTLQEIAVELEQFPVDLERRVAGGKARVLSDLKSRFKSLNAIETTMLQNIEANRGDKYFNEAIAAVNTIEPKGFLEFVKQKARPQDFKIVLFTSPKMAKDLQAKQKNLKVLSE